MPAPSTIVPSAKSAWSAAGDSSQSPSSRSSHPPGSQGGDAATRERLAGFKAPKAAVFGVLPKTSTGKVQKFVLRERLRAHIAALGLNQYPHGVHGTGFVAFNLKVRGQCGNLEHLLLNLRRKDVDPAQNHHVITAARDLFHPPHSARCAGHRTRQTARGLCATRPHKLRAEACRWSACACDLWQRCSMAPRRSTVTSRSGTCRR